MENAHSPTLLITGGARRVGACIADTFHKAGYNVAIHYRSSRDEVDLLVEKLNAERPGSANAIAQDFADRVDGAPLVEATLDWFGRLDVLVNNASSFYPTEIGQITEQDWDNLFASNAKAPLFISQSALPALREAAGAIINIVDIYAERPAPRHTTYCMAKAALAMMTKSLAREMGPEVRVNGVSPGAILWAENETSDKMKQSMLARTALKRIGEPEDIARTALFLAQSNYITGQILAVDGGRSLNI